MDHEGGGGGLGWVGLVVSERDKRLGFAALCWEAMSA